MLLKLHDSKLFTTDPAARFAEQYSVKAAIWNKVWAKALEGYETEFLAGYILYQSGHKLSKKTVRRWLARTEIYCRADHVMRMGVRIVQSEYFGVYEDFIINEVLHNMRFAGTQESKILL